MSAGRLDRLAAALLLAAVAAGTALTEPTATHGRDVYRHLLVFDITQSMNVPDAARPQGEPPRTRLDQAKEAAADALAGLPCGSEVGLGLFTGHRTLVLFTPVEVCEHYDDISTTIHAIDWRMAWAARSEVAKGVHSSLRIAADLERATSVVFLTDGHEAPPLHPDHLPRYRGVPGDVQGTLVGVGGRDPVPIPKLGSDGRARGVWGADEVMQIDTFTAGRATSIANEGLSERDVANLDARIAAGREHLSSLRDGHLRDLAERLAIGYVGLTDADSLETTLRAPDLAVRHPGGVDLRPALAALALALLLVTCLPRRRRRRGQG